MAKLGKNQVPGLVCPHCKRAQVVGSRSMLDFYAGKPIKCFWCSKPVDTLNNYFVLTVGEPGSGLGELRAVYKIPRKVVTHGNLYKKGMSCVKQGKEHNYINKGTYLKCTVCGSSKTLPKYASRSKLERM